MTLCNRFATIPVAFLAAVFTSSAPADTVRIAICQLRAADGEVPANVARVETAVAQAASDGAQICVFPELMDVGFGSVGTPSAAQNARPIPGETSNALGALAARHGVWIATALLEAVAGGCYDTSVVIDDRGHVVLKQRKAFVYPSFRGTPAFQGNYHDAQLIDSPWGPLGVMNCADIGAAAKRSVFPAQDPALMLVSFANPQANLLDHCRSLATECACPVVGVNMVFSGENNRGGKSRFCSAQGDVLWQAPAGSEVVEIRELTVHPPPNLRPRVSAGEVQTVRWPRDNVRLSGFAIDDGLLDGKLTAEWSLVGGPQPVAFENRRDLATKVTFAASGVYRLRLTADDGTLKSSDDLIVSVLPEGGGDPNLAGYWKFDNSADDSSGHGNQATLVGDAAYAADPAPTDFTNSHSLDLGGTDGYARVEHHASLDALNTVTVALWVKPRSYPGFWPTGNDWAALLSKGETWGQQNYMFGLGAYFYLHADGMGMRIPSLGDSVRTPGRWHHVAVVLDGVKKRGQIFIDGVLDHTVYNMPTVYTNSDPLYMGTHKPAATKIDGQIDDVRLYTRPLSETEIVALVPGAVLNENPRVDAGGHFDVTLPESANLAGSYADDGHPPTSATAHWTAWRKVSGPGRIYFENRFSLKTKVEFSQPGTYLLELQGSDGAHMARDTVTITVRGDPPFRRGDANLDASTDISDGIFVLFYLFAGGLAPACLDAADGDDSGALDLTDVIATLEYLFLERSPPAGSFGACDLDLTPDALTCLSFPSCP